MSLAAKQQALIEDLNLIPDVHERLGAVTSYAARMKLDPAQQIDANIVPGCVSRVWLHGVCENGRTRFDCHTESPMVKALAALLCDLYSDVEPAEAANIEPEIWQACQFTKILSPTRLNGLTNMRQRIRTMSEAWLLAEDTAEKIDR